MAVKVIDKLRFPTKQESQLRNEVAILQVNIRLWSPAQFPPRKDLPFPLPPFRGQLTQAEGGQGRLPGGGNMHVGTEGWKGILNRGTSLCKDLEVRGT